MAQKATAEKARRRAEKANRKQGSHICVHDLTVTYDGNAVIKGVTSRIPDRRITTIIGPSGCGKTTLLKSMNRLIDLAEGAKVTGRVMVDGADIFAKGTDVASLRKKMGLLLQKPYPLPMSIRANVAYGPRVNGLKDRKALDAIVEKNLKAAGLWDEVKDRLDVPASKLSVGQQQRLCLARCLAIEPEIILADEPTSALDPISSKLIEQRLIELKRDYTIIVVTHNLRQAKRLADHVLFLYMGELVEQGPADKVFNSPHDKRTRDYMKGVIS